MQQQIRQIVPWVFWGWMALGILMALCQWWLAFWILFATWVLCIFAFAWMLLRFSLDIHFAHNMVAYSDYVSERKIPAFMRASAWFSRHARPVSITSKDHLHLSGEWIPAQKADNHRYVIVVHGYGNAAADAMCVYAKGFYDLGYGVLCPHLRAHGVSEGRWMTMGWKEKEDIGLWMEWIVQQDPQASMVLFGVSMGAATVMMCASSESNHLAGIVEDCGYTSLWQEFAWQLRSLFGLPPFPILYAAWLLAFCFLHLPLRRISSVKALEHARVPVLFIHGDRDTFVPYAMLESNYNACTFAKEKVCIPGAFHAQSIYRNPDLYWHSIARFLQSLPQPKSL